MRKYEPSTERPGRIFKRQNGHALKNEQLRVWLRETDIALDGALFFDNDGDTVKSLFHALRLKMEGLRIDYPINDQNRAEIRRLVKRICIHADWSSWAYNERPEWYIESPRCPLSRADVVDITIERDALKKPHNFMTRLSGWITENGDLGVFNSLYTRGNTATKLAALKALRKAAPNFFYTSYNFSPENWPALVLRQTDAIMQDDKAAQKLREEAAGISEFLKSKRAYIRRAALAEALRPFQV
ncbi:MAG: hypothetical protein EBQ96_04065 [Proteobacteria bacterium]|nr:hypothetical protein [Pseudomonadota bacterium]